MSDAPERIYYAGGHAWENPSLKRDKTEYIRADVARADIQAAVQRAIEACAARAGANVFPVYGQIEAMSAEERARLNECARIQNALRALLAPAALERIIDGGKG